MKSPARIMSCLLASLCPAIAAPASKGGVKHLESQPVSPKYKAESPLPVGWPEPGPFDQVVRKHYPAYRAAVTPDSIPNSGFRRLFKHISRNKIPMTSPVEMKLNGSDAEVMEEMAFLYRSPEVGKAGEDGELVEVRDMPARDVLSYAWQGGRNTAATTKARAAIDAALAKQKLKASGYRLLGYNSPFVPRSKQTYELQALLK